MCKRKGEALSGVAFYNQLYSDDSFCLHLGKVMLSASRLESELIKYLSNKKVSDKIHRKTLGNLILVAEKHSLLENMTSVLKEIKDQRNYLSHNLHALFVGLIDETILPKSGLLDSDIDVFTERAIQLDENLSGLAGIIAKYNGSI